MANLNVTQSFNGAAYGCIPTVVLNNTSDCSYYPSFIKWLVLVKKTYSFTDVSDPVEWAAAITAGNVYIIPVSGKMAEPEYTMSAGKGRAFEKLRMITHAFDVKLDNPDNNFTLIKKLNNKPEEFGVIVVYEDQTGWAAMKEGGEIFEDISFQAGYSGADDMNREGMIKGRWRNKEMPYAYTIPNSILP